MAKTKRIPIYMRDIIDDFGPIYPRITRGYYRLSLSGLKLGGRFVVAGEPGEESMTSSLN